MVLRSAGLIVDITSDIGDLNDRIDASSSVYGIVCCHTATYEQCNEVIAIADRNRIALLKLESLIAPLDLIDRVSSMINNKRND